ncbi:hypothetical protein AWM75_08200 [Aerococcus urinaehominis]|uniref:Uncharacterized protein n=1 Tax=Aerococcus urinaehominis TaxID=128944 RepID=A0A0X8FNL0_9LACT|nr:MetQ/NlpA family ABC transporter substrate-binding protein [Aerococcus urinaehominis]AMB99952.1 hypothetical protein AWM75_08200 [Aerococcus urinaehominis]SDM64152.1 D-methionine transport system substrate-binding protein [Aerococcus urinaehominis]
MKPLKYLLAVTASLFLVACGGEQGADKNQASQSGDLTEITIASKGSDAEVWRHIADLDETKEAGFKLKVEDFVEGPQINQATAEGEVDVNAFQNFGYVNAYNEEAADDLKLATIGTTYLEPMGLYSKKHQVLSDLPDGATIGLPEYPSDQSRAVKLLAAAGLVKLDTNQGLLTTANIIDNPKNLTFNLINENTLPRVLDDLDAAAIGNTISLEAGLKVNQDTIYKEEVSEENAPSVNILVTAAGRENEDALKKLVDLYHLPVVQDYVNEKFEGTKIPVHFDDQQVKSAMN